MRETEGNVLEKLSFCIFISLTARKRKLKRERDYPKVCVNFQTDVRKITQFGGLYYGKKAEIHKRQQ